MLNNGLSQGFGRGSALTRNVPPNEVGPCQLVLDKEQIAYQTYTTCVTCL